MSIPLNKVCLPLQSLQASILYQRMLSVPRVIWTYIGTVQLKIIKYTDANALDNINWYYYIF
jgi:hypothetical protein